MWLPKSGGEEKQATSLEFEQQGQCPKSHVLESLDTEDTGVCDINLKSKGNDPKGNSSKGEISKKNVVLVKKLKKNGQKQKRWTETG